LATTGQAWCVEEESMETFMLLLLVAAFVMLVSSAIESRY
jgi:hypothetical protein